MLSVPRAVHDLLAPARSSVRLSVQEIGFGDFVQIAVHVLSLACGNAPVAATAHRYKNRHAPFLFLSPNRSTTHPDILPSILVASSCASLRHVIVSRKDRSATDRATGNKTAPSTVLLKELCMHRSHGPLQCPSPFQKGVPLEDRRSLFRPFPGTQLSMRSPYVFARSHPVFRYEADFEGDINSARTGPAGGGSVPGPRSWRRTLYTTKSAPVRNALRPLRAVICGVKFRINKKTSLNPKK